MLDNNSKKVLKYLNDIIVKSNHYSYILLDTLKDVLTLDECDLKICLDYLIKLELIEYTDEYDIEMYRSTIKGLMYFKNNRKKIYFDILLVIISAITSSLITILLT